MSGGEVPPIPLPIAADVESLRRMVAGIPDKEQALERLVACVSLQQLALESARETSLEAIAAGEAPVPPTTKELLEMPRAELERHLGRPLATAKLGATDIWAPGLGPHRREADPDLVARPFFGDKDYAEPRCPERDCGLEESHDGEHRFKCAGQFCRGFPYRASERGHPVFCATGTETILDGTSIEDVAAAALDAHRAALPPLPIASEPFPGIKCDNCDRPATQVARDSHERFDPTASFQEYDPGPNKYGCQDHPVGSKMIAAGHAEMMAAVTDAGEDLEADVAEMKAALERDEIDPESLRTASLDGVSMAALEANGEMLALSGEVDAELLDAEVRTYPEILKDGPPPYGECDWGGCDEPAVEWRPATGSPDQRLPVCARHTARAELSYQSVTDDRGIEPSESPHHPGGLGNREHPGLGNQDAGAGLEYTAETDATLQDSKRRQHEAAKADAAAEAEADPDPADTADLEDLG